MTKERRRITLPEGVERVAIVNGKMSASEHEDAVLKDFDENRVEYIEVELYGVPVLVKVQQTK